MALTKEQAALTFFAAAEGLHAYSAFLPSIMTIEKFVDDEQAFQSIRRGEYIATGFILVMGWAVSEIADTYWPLIGTIFAAFAALAVYESALRRKFGSGAVAGAAKITAGSLFPGFSEVAA